MVVVNLEIVLFQVTLTSYRVTVEGFVPVKAFSKSQKLLFVSASSFLFLYYLYKVCPKSVLRPRTSLKLRVFRSDYTMATVVKIFFQFRHFQIVENTLCLGLSVFLTFKELQLNFFLFWKIPIISFTGSLFDHEMPECLEESGTGTKESECPHN